ncbi:MAG: endonuclease III [Nitrospirota bacterium]|nr:endonuclease III [Nitrospirota bacterium]
MHQDQITAALRIVKREIRQWEEPVLGIVSRESNRDPFRILISCLLSLRTKDKTTGEASARLFALAHQPATMLTLPLQKIERAIYPVGFYRIKAKSIHAICCRLLDVYGGTVPDSIEELVTLSGVGRKTANLLVTVGYGKPGICVDIHVHRISNRWGYVKTKTPEETEQALRRKLPAQHWITFNDLLVPYGQNLCQPVSPFCSQCTLTEYCDRVGVKRSR